MLLNLAINARDAMPMGGRLSLSTGLVDLDDTFKQIHGYESPGTYALISVSDTGIGMEKETIEKIFDPFFTTKATGKGTGLGLSMAYGVVKQHGGYITVYSEPGRGATFKIYLPIAKNGEELYEKRYVESLPRGAAEVILVAEDDEKLRQLYDIVLTRQGYKVIQTKDGEEAIRKFAEHRNDIRLAILDMIMPLKSGKEVYDEIRLIRPDIKVLFSTGYTADRVDKDALLNDNLNFLIKPVSPQDLLRKVMEILTKD